MKHYLFGILLLFCNVTFSQTYEQPDNWFLGIKYTSALSGVELKPNTKEYKFNLELWLRTLYDGEIRKREFWFQSGAKENLEPDEFILLPNDFSTSSTKFKRMIQKAQDSQLEKYKIILQMFLLQTYKFDIKEIEFDEEGNLSSIMLFKNVGENINTSQTKQDFALLKKMLENVYGKSQRDTPNNSIAYSWFDIKSKIGLIVDLDGKDIAVIYEVKK